MITVLINNFLIAGFTLFYWGSYGSLNTTRWLYASLRSLVLGSCALVTTALVTCFSVLVALFSIPERSDAADDWPQDQDDETRLQLSEDLIILWPTWEQGEKDIFEQGYAHAIEIGYNRGWDSGKEYEMAVASSAKWMERLYFFGFLILLGAMCRLSFFVFDTHVFLQPWIHESTIQAALLVQRSLLLALVVIMTYFLVVCKFWRNAAESLQPWWVLVSVVVGTVSLILGAWSTQFLTLRWAIDSREMFLKCLDIQNLPTR